MRTSIHELSSHYGRQYRSNEERGLGCDTKETPLIQAQEELQQSKIRQAEQELQKREPQLETRNPFPRSHQAQGDEYIYQFSNLGYAQRRRTVSPKALANPTDRGVVCAPVSYERPRASVQAQGEGRLLNAHSYQNGGEGSGTHGLQKASIPVELPAEDVSPRREYGTSEMVSSHNEQNARRGRVMSLEVSSEIADVQTDRQLPKPSLREFVQAQKTTGSFPLSADLRRRVLGQFQMGFDQAIIHHLRKSYKLRVGADEVEVCDTVMCIYLIKNQPLGFTELWELMIGKAEGWLNSQIERGDLQGLLDLAATNWIAD